MIQQNISLLAQQDEQLISDTGVHAGIDSAICLESSGLLAMSSGDNAKLTLDVLQDDMSLNLAQALCQSSGTIAGVSQCLQESLENLNDFLLQQSAASEVDLGVIQLGHQHFSAWVSGNICGARFRSDSIKLLCDEGKLATLAGTQSAFSPKLLELDFEPADILLLTTQTVFETLEEDFVRLTLLRFNDNLHMALRQLNTRAMRNGLLRKPQMLLCRIDQPAETSGSGWFKRLRKR